MIQGFSDKRAEKLWVTHSEHSFGDLQKIILRKLTMMHAAAELNDLRVPPANRLEKLSGNRRGQYSIRINDQFRICFTWNNTGPSNIEVIDYH
ncbi:MAG: type II toxin-antitoxin system RelE/ParE family toxin [Mycobacteriaceae bacterium]